MPLKSEAVGDHDCLFAHCDGGHILKRLQLLNYRLGRVDLRSIPYRN
jgi:hypothetical protein